MPVGARPNGVLYPFFVVSAVQRPGALLFEVGMRVNFITFHFDDYEVRPGDQLTRAFEERQMKMPYLFFNFGLRMFSTERGQGRLVPNRFDGESTLPQKPSSKVQSARATVTRPCAPFQIHRVRPASVDPQVHDGTRGRCLDKPAR